MKVLVTGGAGFIGSHVVDTFLSAGHEVVIVDDLSTGRERNINPKARFYKMDIRDPRLIEILESERPEVVDHHAAQMDVRKSVVDPMFDADVNIRGTLNLLEAARKTRVRKIVYISSGGAAYGEPVYLPCDEAHPVNPLCPYGVTKHTVEHYLFLYKELYGLDYAVLRYPNVYGPRQDPHGEAGVVAIFTGLMLKGKPITINGSGEQQRDFVFVSDCARANLMVSSQGPSGIFNLGCGEGTNINQIFAGLKQITGYIYEANYGPGKTGETFKIYLDSQRARREFGWEPSLTLAEGLEKTVEYFKHNEVDA
jgi:UDP-glucose 4-epimerase